MKSFDLGPALSEVILSVSAAAFDPIADLVQMSFFLLKEIFNRTEVAGVLDRTHCPEGILKWG